jgi:hypothetical protein
MTRLKDTATRGLKYPGAPYGKKKKPRGRDGKRPPQYFAADPRLRKDDAEHDPSGFARNDSMGGESGRYDDHLRWLGTHPGD